MTPESAEAADDPQLASVQEPSSVGAGHGGSPIVQRAPRRAPARYGVHDALTPAQSRTLGLVLEDPGATIQRIAQRLRVTHATASYHLSSLARVGLVVQVRDGREVLHFPGQKTPAASLYVAALWRDERKARILQLLAEMPPQRWTLHQLAGKAETSFGILKRTLRQLEWAKLIVLERRRFRYAIHVGDELRAALTAAGVRTRQGAPPADVKGDPALRGMPR